MSNKTDNSATDSSNKIGNVAATKKTADQKNKPAKEKTTLDGAGAANNSGWFGGIWNKITLKPKNQMILPDDKNPSVIFHCFFLNILDLFNFAVYRFHGMTNRRNGSTRMKTKQRQKLLSHLLK